MSNVTQKINLAALKNVEFEMPRKDGTKVRGMFIPYEANHIYVSDKEGGGRYLDLISFDRKTPTDQATHITKQSLSKEIREKMTKEEQDAMPIVGDLKVWGAAVHQEASGNPAPAQVFDPSSFADDLPF